MTETPLYLMLSWIKVSQTRNFVPIPAIHDKKNLDLLYT
jgi:hypothetical protein